MMPQFLLSESTVHVLAQVAFHFLWQGALLGLSAACLLHVLPIRTAHARYAFFCGLLTLLAICPLVNWRGIDAGPADKIDIQGESAKEASNGAVFQEGEEGAAELIAMQSNAAQSNFLQSMIQPPDSRLQVAGTWLSRQCGLIVTAWLVGICCMAMRLLLGAIGLCTLARRRQPIPPTLAHVVDRLSRRLAFHVRPAVHLVERISQAMAVGIVKPMVLLPASWISELPSDVLEAVIAHELAHLRRWDLPINLMQRVVETLLFFHPAIWWCSRRLRIEREMCCDELAQAAVGNRVVYAKALAYLAHQQSSSVEFLLAAGIGGKKMVLLDRICNILGMTPGRRGRLYGPSCALVGAALMSLAWIAAFGLPAQWQPRTSNSDEGGIVSNSERSAASEVAKTKLATDSIEQSLRLDEVIEAPEPREFWDLSLEEAIRTSTANSKAMRSMCSRQVSPTCNNGPQATEVQQSPAVDGALSAHANADTSVAEFEITIRNIVNDTKCAYWELYFTYRNLDALVVGRDSALSTWRKVKTLYDADARGGEAEKEAQSREQYFLFRGQVEAAVSQVYEAENRLRYQMGIAPTDGRLIRPMDNPTTTRIDFDWEEIKVETLARMPELRRQRWIVKQRELQLSASKNLLPPRFDFDECQEEWQMGFQANIPIGFRAALAGVRNAQLQLARERAVLQDEELEMIHGLTSAIRTLDRTYQLTETNFNRMIAARVNVKAVRAAYETDTVTLDLLLDAQRRLAVATSDYFRSLIDYNLAIRTVHYRKGSLL